MNFEIFKEFWVLIFFQIKKANEIKLNNKLVILSSIIVTAVSIFMQTPAYGLLNKFSSKEIHESEFGAWSLINKQIKEPFTPNVYDPGDHKAKRAFRILVPIFMKSIGVNEISYIIFIQQLINVLLIFLLLKILLIRLDYLSSLLIMIALSSTYTIYGGFWDLAGYFDSFAFFLMALALYISFKNSYLPYFFIFLSFWVDERAITASLGLFFFILYNSKSAENLFKKVIFQGLTYFTVLILYAFLRKYLEEKYNLKIYFGDENGVGFKRIIQAINELPLAIFEQYKFLWIIIIGFGFYCIKMKHYLVLTFSLICLIASLGPALLVADFSRSFGYSFPVLIFSIFYLSENSESGKYDYRLIFLICLGNLIFPTYHLMSTNSWIFPLPLSMINNVSIY